MKLNHQNVAVFRGVTMGRFQVALIYDWGDNGTIMEYLELHPDSPRLTLVTHLTSYT